MVNIIDITILILVTQLGSDDFKTREIATKTLTKMMPECEYKLLIIQPKDPEQRCRIKIITKKWYYQDNLLSLSRYPFISYKKLPGYYSYLNKATTLGIPNKAPTWEAYRFATKLYVISLYERQVPREVIVQILNDFAFEEEEFFKKYDYKLFEAFNIK